MTLDAGICYRALETRDERFDGRFFTGVRSTGVFCRPVCPAKKPRRENCVFFAHAAQAQEAGFRPCLRCRPEASPGSPPWQGTCSTVRRALRLIENGALNDAHADELAVRLGVGERHLRRLFAKHIGASPSQMAQTRRILFAKQLLNETRLSMSQIARAAGFRSTRRFNAAMQATYERPPSQLRRSAAGSATANSSFELQLAYRPPYPWQTVLQFLRPRVTSGVELVTSDAYMRVLQLASSPALIEVRAPQAHNHLTVRVRTSDPSGLLSAVQRIRAFFDLDADPALIAADLSHDARLRSALAAAPGLRIPGAWDGFELAVRAILGQQVSVQAATTLAGRLVRAYGDVLPTNEGFEPNDALGWTFPTASKLADQDLAHIGLPGARAQAIRNVAQAVAQRRVRFDASQDPEETRRELQSLGGIGDWTAQYIAMRALRDPDAFPAGDLGLRRALATTSKLATESAVKRRAETWRPWRAYAALYLWNEEASHAAASQ